MSAAVIIFADKQKPNGKNHMYKRARNKINNIYRIVVEQAKNIFQSASELPKKRSCFGQTKCSDLD